VQSKDNIKSNCLKTFNTDGIGKNEVCNCLVNKIVFKFKPSAWFNSSKLSQNTIQKEKLDKCFLETDNNDLKIVELNYLAEKKKKQESFKNQIANADNLIQESFAASTIGDYAEAKSKLLIAIDSILNNPELKTYYGSKWLAGAYNSLAWWSILQNEMNETGKYLKKGLSFNSQDMFLRENLGLYHLLNNNYPEAVKAFQYYKRKEKFPDGRKWVNVLAEDLELIESRGMGNSDFEKVRSLLKIK
jgi:hypothetical protein